MSYLLRRALGTIRQPFRRRPDFTAMRVHERLACCAVATLVIDERGVELDGLVLEASFGGLLFREASTYIFDRTGAPITAKVAGLELHGSIANVRSTGYGIKLDRIMGEAELQAILQSSDIRPALPTTH
jgi:hypothetical protein